MQSRCDIDRLRPALAQAARAVYDDWERAEDGLSEDHGTGGICQDIATAMARILDEAGVETVEIFTEYDGGHVFLLACLEDGVFSVDVPAGIYEIGYGYVWRKREGVSIDADCVAIDRVSDPIDVATFRSRHGEDAHPEVVDLCPEDSFPAL